MEELNVKGTMKIDIYPRQSSTKLIEICTDKLVRNYAYGDSRSIKQEAHWL